MFTVALWPSPALRAIAVAASGVPVAWKVTAPTLAVAVSVFAPEVVPSVHEPTVATPLALVVAFRPLAEPPPVPRANVTAMPETGLPN